MKVESEVVYTISFNKEDLESLQEEIILLDWDINPKLKELYQMLDRA